MVTADQYPKFPVLECQACQERFEVPRKWVNFNGIGNQIIMDWGAADELMKIHHQFHSGELVQGVEEYLATQGPRNS